MHLPYLGLFSLDQVFWTQSLDDNCTGSGARQINFRFWLCHGDMWKPWTLLRLGVFIYKLGSERRHFRIVLSIKNTPWKTLQEPGLVRESRPTYLSSLSIHPIIPCDSAPSFDHSHYYKDHRALKKKSLHLETDGTNRTGHETHAQRCSTHWTHA